MAIALLGLTGTSGGNGTSVASFTLTKPGSLADGAVMVLAVGSNNGAFAGGSQTKNTDATWTRLATGQDAGTSNVGVSIFRRVVATAASEPASYAFSFVQQNDDTTSQTVSYGWVLSGFSGVDNATPEDVTTPATTATASTSTTSTTATSSVTDSAWAVGCCSCDITSATWVAPAGYSNLVGQVTGRSTAMATKTISPSGVIAAAAFTNTAGGPGVGDQVVLRPASAGGGIPPGVGPANQLWEPNMDAAIAAMMR